MKISGSFLSELIENLFEEDKEYNYCDTETTYINGLIKENKEKYNHRKKEIKLDSTSKIQLDQLDSLINIDNIKELINQIVFALTRSQVLTLPEFIDSVVSKIMINYF